MGQLDLVIVGRSGCSGLVAEVEGGERGGWQGVKQAGAPTQDKDRQEQDTDSDSNYTCIGT